MKSQLKSRLRLTMIVIVFVLAIFACPDEDAIDAIQCGTLIQTCGDVEYVVMRGVKNLSENVEGDIRYYRFYDCATESWIRTSGPADCTVEIR